MNYTWSDLAFASKAPLNDMNAIFILAPREMSRARLKQLIKNYLPQANLVIGIAQEDYVQGFEGQSQFRMLKRAAVSALVDKVNSTSPAHVVATLIYPQRDAKFLLAKLKFKKVVAVNGSWQFVFHSRPEYYALQNAGITYELVSPFFDEAEAKKFADDFRFDRPKPDGAASDHELMALARDAARESFDYNMQTGVALAKRVGTKYELITTAFNRVIPYQTYAMHHGASRETNFAPMHDLNFYDTNHAEIEFLVKAQKSNLGLKNTTLFINLMPCPTCARMFSITDISEFVYRQDHSGAQAVKILEQAGKKVRRLV